MLNQARSYPAYTGSHSLHSPSDQFSTSHVVATTERHPPGAENAQFTLSLRQWWEHILTTEHVRMDQQKLTKHWLYKCTASEGKV